VLREQGLVGGDAVAVEGVVVGRRGAAQVLGVELALALAAAVQLLAVAQRHGLAAAALQAHAHDADDVLAHVVEEAARRRRQPRHGRAQRGDAHGLVGLGHEAGGRVGAQRDRLPGRVVEARLVPAPGQAPRVVALAVLQVGLQPGAGSAAPLRVAAPVLHAAVGIGDAQLGLERELLAVDAAPAHADLAAVPAVGQRGAQRVGAGAQQRGDVVGLHLQALRVVRPARRQGLVAHRPAIHPQLVDALGGGVQPRLADGLVELQAAAQQRQGLARRIRCGAYPGGAGPVGGADEAGLEGAGPAPGADAALVVPGAQLPVIARGRPEAHGLGQGDVDLPRRRDLARRPDIAGARPRADADLVGARAGPADARLQRPGEGDAVGGHAQRFAPCVRRHRFDRDGAGRRCESSL
jgi:hypothetical protein